MIRCFVLLLLPLLGSAANFFKLGVGVYVLNIADVNVVAGSFYADYLLTVYKDETNYEELDDLLDTFSNSNKRECSTRQVEKTKQQLFKPFNYTADDIFIVNVDQYHEFIPVLDINSSRLGQYRVMGIHYFQPVLKEWPFDSQRLPVIIELAKQVATEDIMAVVCFMPEFSGISSSVMFPGSSSHTLSFDYETVERCWPPFVHPSATCSGSNFGTSDCDCPSIEVHDASLGVPHSRFQDFSCRCKGGKNVASEYQFSITYDSPESRGFQKAVLPVIFIMLVNTISYLIPPEENSIRVSTCSTTLVSAVLFHSGLENQIPATGSLSAAEVLLIVNYTVNLVSWVVTLVIVVSVNSPLIKIYNVHTHVYLVTRIFGPILSLSLIPAFVVYYKKSLWWSLFLSMTLGMLLSIGLYIVQNQIFSLLKKKREKDNETRNGSSESDRTDGISLTTKTTAL